MNDIVLNIPQEKHKYLMKTLDSFKSGIRMLGMNPIYKQSLMRDIYTIESIVKTNQLKENNNGRHNDTSSLSSKAGN